MTSTILPSKVREAFLATVLAKINKKPLPAPLPTPSLRESNNKKEEVDGRTNNS